MHELNDYTLKLLADDRIAEMHAQAEHDRLVRQIAPHQFDLELLITLTVIAVVMGMLLLVG